MITLHILSNPNGPVNFNNKIDPFSIAAWKFIYFMQKRGWNCIHYSVPGANVPCKTVPCLDYFRNTEENIRIYNENAGAEINKNKQAGDIILCFYGYDDHKAALANADLKIVEPSIGYSYNAVFADFRIFTSYAQMHMFYGFKNILFPSWFDAVIPNAISSDEFEYSDDKSDYILFFGRVIDSKGVNVAIQATEQAGCKLIIAGPGNLVELGYTTIPDHVTCVGPCNIEQRKTLMKNARAIIAPTYYVEPFGNMVVESLMSGTPAITSDWGGFTETVINGITGYRCREMQEFIRAIENIDKINNKVCREWALRNCSDDVVHDKFNDYLIKITQMNFYR